jgi:acetylglutamate kinase
MEKLYIIKIGGNIIDEEVKLSSFLKELATLQEKKILIHGGGKLATQLAADLGVEQQMVDGRRITDKNTLRIVTMVYAGYINKNIVAKLQSFGCNAIGLSGADGNLVRAHKRKKGTVDYGFAGDIDSIDSDLASDLLERGMTMVIAPITHNREGQLLNTNADTMAQEIAKSMSSRYEVSLIYSFEKSGVLLDANDDSTTIPILKPAYYDQLKKEQKIFAGMIPKLDNAFSALSGGVRQVTIGKAEQLQQLIAHTAGTKITND